MAYPASPQDSGTYRIGMIVKKVSSTLTAAVIRAIAITTGSDPVGWAGMATHVEDDPAVVADASATPGVLMFGKRGSHVSVATADVGALQVDTAGALMVDAGVGALTPGTTGVHTTGTTATNIVTDANCAGMYIRNIDSALTIYWSFSSGVTADENATTGGFQVPAGDPWLIPVKGAQTVYFRSASGTPKFCFAQFTTS